MDRSLSNLKLLLILTFLSILISALDVFRILNLPKQFLSYLTNPISFGLYQTNQNIGRQFYFIFEARFAAKENKALKEQIGKLFSENSQLRKKLAEAQSLLSQVQHLDPQTYNLISVHPIGIGRYLKIDKGANSGLKLNQSVVVNDNYVGKISKIEAQTANVQLLSDPQSKVAAFSQGLEGKAKGILIGQFSTDILLDKILHEEKISVGDLVYTDGTEGYLPRGLILGRVTQVLEQPTQVFKQAKVVPNFDIRDMELVYVIAD